MSQERDNKDNARKRTSARLAAVKALYNYEISDGAKDSEAVTFEILAYCKDEGIHIDKSYLKKIISGTCQNISDIDSTITKSLSEEWKFDRIDNVVKSLLRAAVYELCMLENIPLKVVINEYVDVSRMFFDEKEVGFVNGILHKIGHEVRDDG